MEQLKHNDQEDLTSVRQEAVAISNNLVQKREQFLQEITEIVNANNALKKGLYKYGSIEESLADFKVVPWGNGNLDKHSLDISGIIDANTNHKPALNVLHDIESELNARIISIKETLSSFLGTEEEAFDLVQEIHKNKNLEPLNSDATPFLEKIS